MRNANRLLIAALITITACFMQACNNHQTQNNAGNNAPANTSGTTTAAPTATTSTTQPVKTHPKSQNAFYELRTTAFTLNPTQLKLNIAADKDVVYGVIYDRKSNDDVTTIAAYLNGDARLYHSTANTANKANADAAKAFVAAAQDCLPQATKAHDTSVPEKATIKFYLLTNRGIYVIAPAQADVEKPTPTLNKLLAAGNNTLASFK